MSPIDIATVAGVVVVGANFVWTVYWSVKVKRDIEAAIKHTDVRHLSDRLLKLETDVNHMPTHDDMATMHVRVNDVRKELAKLCAEMSANNEAVEGLKRSVDLLIKHEMKDDR